MAGNLRGRYPLAVGIALLGLIPNVVLSTAFLPLQDVLTAGLGSGTTSVSVALGLSGAAYAVGAVVAAQLALRIIQRRIFLVSEAGFVAASVLAAVAPDAGVFLVGHLLQGLAAGAMLITSLPPLVTRFGASRVPLSAAIVNVGIFGASTLGPLVGGMAASPGSGWRWMLAAAAVLAAVGWLLAALGYDVWEPPAPDHPVDAPALVLVVLSTTAIFVGSSLVEGRSFVSWQVLAPLVAGLVILVALLIVESRKEDSLVPVGALATQLPVTGILVAMVGGAVFVSVLELIETRALQVGGRTPLELARGCWPLPVGAAVGAFVFWRLFTTRWVPVLVDVGLLALVAGAVLPLAGPADDVPAGALLLLGLGAAATVSPGLFLTGFGLASADLGRAFALVQLLRSVATYAVAPVAVALVTAASSVEHAVEVGLVVMAALAAAGLVSALVIPAVSGARLREPDIAAWLEGEPGLPSPTTATHLRPAVDDDDAAPLIPRPSARRDGAHRDDPRRDRR